MKKICAHCKEEKSVSDFWKKKSTYDGYQPSCKLCISSMNKSWKYNNKEKYKENTKRYNTNAATRKAEWYKNNKEKLLSASKIKREKERQARPEKPAKEKIQTKKRCPIRRKIICAKYYESHKKEQSNRAKEWRIKNKDKAMATVARRRAKRKLALVNWRDDFIIKEIYALADLRTKMTKVKWEVDHIVPLQSDIVCGLHWEMNMQVITKSANIRKGNRYWPDMP